MEPRRVGEHDVDAVTEIFTLAFHDDPTWSWAFPDAGKRKEQHRRWWGLHMHSAVPYGWVWITKDGSAASLWIPAGKPELSDEDEEKVEPILREMLGSHANDVMSLLENFDSNHPADKPHYYLSLLGTHPDHRGKGEGMGRSRRIWRCSTRWGCPPTWSRATERTTTVTSALVTPRLGSSLRRVVNRPWPACGAILVDRRPLPSMQSADSAHR